jgi:myosin heavy subunit
VLFALSLQQASSDDGCTQTAGVPERNYHIFYQLILGEEAARADLLLLPGQDDPEDRQELLYHFHLVNQTGCFEVPG